MLWLEAMRDNLNISKGRGGCMSKRGEKREYPGMTLTCMGAYFDWPWWKRRLSDVVAPVYSNLWAAPRWIRAMALRRRHSQSFELYPRDVWKLLTGLKHSQVKPIFFEAAFPPRGE